MNYRLPAARFPPSTVSLPAFQSLLNFELPELVSMAIQMSNRSLVGLSQKKRQATLEQ